MARQKGKVAIIGVATTQLRPSTPDISYKELMFEAALQAYQDANVNPRKDVQSFVCSSEDFMEGTSIFDEYVPDQIGGVLKPVCTIAGDGLHAFVTAQMQIMSGLFDVVAVEAHSKVSEIVSLLAILELACDPIFTRPLSANPYFIAGLEMRRFLDASKYTPEDCAEVVVQNREKAMRNALSAYGGKVTKREVLKSEPLAEPLKKADISAPADGAAVVVLASQEVAQDYTENPVWVFGSGWCNDSPTLESRSWETASYAEAAAKDAYRAARIEKPSKELDLAEIDDTFSYKQLQHTEALGLTPKGKATETLRRGAAVDVNPSGGSLGMGNTFEASGLVRLCQAVIQLRGNAGRHQVKDAKVAVVQSWRGIPTTSGVVTVLGAG